MAEIGEVATAVNSMNSAVEFSSANPVEQQDHNKSDCCNSPIHATNPRSSDDIKVEPKANPEQAVTDEATLQQERQPSASPEPNCSICLGKMENKSFTNSCFHQFCFTCLLEWSKVKPECPLCKQPFKSIVHNVRSMEDYDQYHLRFEDFNSWENPDGRRFRYRSTLTSERRRELTLSRLLTTQRLGSSSYQRTTRSTSVLATGAHRRIIYEMDLWVRVSTNTARFRECSPQFYSQNPACTHRLVPWLNRELIALQYGHQCAFLMELILSLLLRFHIRSPEFEELIRPYFLRNTKHFIHEFYSFAQSPYDMAEYDRHASYVNNSDNFSYTDAGNESDSDVIVVSPDRSSRPRWSQRPLPFSFPRQAGNSSSNSSSPSVINRARDFLDSLRMLDGTLSNLRDASTFHSLPASISLPPSPQPGPSGLQSNTIIVNESDSSDEDNYRPTTSNMKQEVVIPDDEDDEEDCVVVGYEKPLLERSPVEVIVLSDSSDEEETTTVPVMDQSLDVAPPIISECSSINTNHSNQQCSSVMSPVQPSPSLSLKRSPQHPSSNSSSTAQLEHQRSSSRSSSRESKRQCASIISSPSCPLQMHSENATTSKTSKHKRHRSSSSKTSTRHKHRGKHHHRSKKGALRSHTRQRDSSDEDYIPNSSHRKSSKKKHKHKKSKSQDKIESPEMKEKQQTPTYTG